MARPLYLGEDEDVPIFTLTSEVDLQTFTKPGVTYLQTIAQGIHQSHGMSHAEIVSYFISKNGVSENYTTEQLLSLIKSENSNRDK